VYVLTLGVTSYSVQIFSSPNNPLRRIVIPPEVHFPHSQIVIMWLICLQQGLGIFEYGHHNLRLSCQFRHALESYCLSQGDYNSWDGASTLIRNGASTLYSEYLGRYISGDNWDMYHEEGSLSLSLTWLLVSAGTGETSSAEAVFPLCSAVEMTENIPDIDSLHLVAAAGLTCGSEFILNDVIRQPVPGKDKFLEAFRTQNCRGVGIVLGIPKSAFDGGGDKSFSQYIGEPIIGAGGIQIARATPEYLFRVASCWGCLDAMKALVSNHRADVNAQDSYGETALLKACRAGHSDIVRWLVQEAGAKASISTRKRITPLHWLNSFNSVDVVDVAKLLKAAGGNPNADAVNNNEDMVENAFYFFKGPPLMRVVASGNIAAVKALLDIGANPTISGQDTTENPIIFAARRLRVDILKVLLEKAPNYAIWDMNTQGNLMRYVLQCSPCYGMKIHEEGYFKAHAETFDFIWSKAEDPSRLFRRITRAGFIPIQVAVQEGHKALVVKIIESCPAEGHLKELTATIGLQTAILYGRQSIFNYLLEQGAQPLHPYLESDPKKDDQFQDYVLYGPWTMHLAAHQRKTTCLHLCAKAGDSSAYFGRTILKYLLPASRWETTPETFRKMDHTVCCGTQPPPDDPVVDCRDEQGRTPFFCALKQEEYELAYQLYQAGANKNALITHPALLNLSEQTPTARINSVDGLPIAEHALSWVSAYRAIHFLIKQCWGCLRLTNTYGDDLHVAAIEETTNWPVEEASIVFEYIIDRAYQNHRLDKQLKIAVSCLNEAATSVILLKRGAISGNTTPEELYQAVLLRLSKTFASNGMDATLHPSVISKHRHARRDTCVRASKIISLIRSQYPGRLVSGYNPASGFPTLLMNAISPELRISKLRYSSNVIGTEKFLNEIQNILEPWIVGIGALRSLVPLLEVEERLREVVGEEVGVELHLDRDGKGLCRDQTKVLKDTRKKKPLMSRLVGRLVKSEKGERLSIDALSTKFDTNFGCWVFQ
jgi:ankyrin repeat protein